jgi:hypothetical protein
LWARPVAGGGAVDVGALRDIEVVLGFEVADAGARDEVVDDSIHACGDSGVAVVELVAAHFFDALAVALEEGLRGKRVGHGAVDAYDFGLNPEPGCHASGMYRVEGFVEPGGGSGSWMVPTHLPSPTSRCRRRTVHSRCKSTGLQPQHLV